MYGQGGFGGGPVGRGRGAAVPAWMADPALAAQAQAPQAHPGAAPPTGFSPPPPSRPETDEEMARRLQAEWSAPAAPPTFPMEPVFSAPPGTTVTVQQHASAEEAYAHALALVNAHVPASAAPPPPMLGAGPPSLNRQPPPPTLGSGPPPLSRQPPPSTGLPPAALAALQKAKAIAAAAGQRAPSGGFSAAAPTGDFSASGFSSTQGASQTSGAVAELLAKMEAQPSNTGPLLPILAKDRARKAKALEKNLKFLERLDGEGQDSEALFAADDDVVTYTDVPGRAQTTAGLGAKGFNRGESVKVHKGENRSVYVTGLEGEFASETHLQQLFAPHGKVVSCKIYKDELDRPKGDALVTFAKGGSARQAAARVHGATLGPCVLKVELATFHSDAALRGGPVLRPDEEHWDSVVASATGLPNSLSPDTKPVVLLRHLYDVAQVASKPSRVFLNELEHEIRGECEKYGAVFHVVAPSTKDLEGSVAVSFDTVKAAEECAQSMDGRWFDNVQILVERRGCWEDLASVQLRGTQSTVVLSVEIAPPECFTVIVHNVWTANEAEACGPAFFDELESEFSQECGKYGPLRSCKAVPREPSLVGAVVVAFSTEEGREKCEGDMDGRWFDFRRLRVERYAGSGAPPTPPRGASLDDFFSSLDGS